MKALRRMFLNVHPARLSDGEDHRNFARGLASGAVGELVPVGVENLSNRLPRYAALRVGHGGRGRAAWAEEEEQNNDDGCPTDATSRRRPENVDGSFHVSIRRCVEKRMGGTCLRRLLAGAFANSKHPRIMDDHRPATDWIGKEKRVDDLLHAVRDDVGPHRVLHDLDFAHGSVLPSFELRRDPSAKRRIPQGFAFETIANHGSVDADDLLDLLAKQPSLRLGFPQNPHVRVFRPARAAEKKEDESKKWDPATRTPCGRSDATHAYPLGEGRDPGKPRLGVQAESSLSRRWRASRRRPRRICR